MPSTLQISLAALQLLVPAFAAHIGKRGLNDDFAMPPAGQAMDQGNDDIIKPIHGGSASSGASGPMAGPGNGVGGSGLGFKGTSPLDGLASGSGMASGSGTASGADSQGPPHGPTGPAGPGGDSGNGWGGCGFEMGGKKHYANDHGEWNFGGQTLTPGGTITYSTNTIVIETQSCTCAIINSQTSAIVPPPPPTGLGPPVVKPTSTAAAQTAVPTTSAPIESDTAATTTCDSDMTETSTEAATTSTACSDMTPEQLSMATGCPASTAAAVTTPAAYTSQPAAISTPAGYGSNVTSPSPSSPASSPEQQIGNSGVRQVASLLLVAAMPVLAFML